MVVTDFVSKLSLPFFSGNRKRIEQDISYSITKALLESSSYLGQHDDSLLQPFDGDMSSISASLHHSNLSTNQFTGGNL